MCLESILVSNANLLSIKSLSVSFGGLKALSNINLDLHANEVVGLIGPNGAGKTTLFNALSGLVDVEAGTLEINNKPHKWPKPYGLVDLGISRTLQGVGLFPELTVLENVMVGDSKSSKSGLISSALGLNGKDEAKLKARAMTALERVYASGKINSSSPRSWISQGDCKWIGCSLLERKPKCNEEETDEHSRKGIAIYCNDHRCGAKRGKQESVYNTSLIAPISNKVFAAIGTHDKKKECP